MAARFTTPIYNVTTQGGQKHAVDVTNSISAGLPPNGGLISHLLPWMKETGSDTVLDFGAGALRHAIPLLKAGYQVIAVEYEKAYTRPRCAEFRNAAKKYSGFTALVWPHDFLKFKLKYDVMLLAYVLQVIPVKVDRDIILQTIGKHFNKNGPRRLYYASRFGEGKALTHETKFNDGWVRGRGELDRSFYAEWNGAETDAFFLKAGYQRAGRYEGASQSFIYQFGQGVF